jgi:hypothetical protein
MSSSGLPSIGTMHLGTVSVIGRSLLPIPAASRNAFTERSPA